MFTDETLAIIRLAAYIIFGAIGFVAFVYGKRNTLWTAMGIGLALIAYPYFVTQVWAVFVIGIALTAALYFTRR